ncbi:hypothetical protein NQ314_006286 [Rhamnusium bicolor]|uniref:Uncharacterized protein n=1 Tax=Rhamnusium bicolor TaxID=1586634 RepID=A0AAV8Z6A2_9CUCU|nr:hypothetical protein NQ314_006286 [Rhamnusium bicolor]
MLSSREQEIDDYITKAKEQSYKQVLDLGSKGVSALMQTAIKSINSSTITSSLSDPAISSHSHDQLDAVKRSHTTENMQAYTLSEDEDFLEPLPAEIPASKAKAPKKATGKAKASGTRKSSRKTKEIKTENMDGGGGIVNQLKKSYSLSDLTDSTHDDGHDETDVLITDPRLVRRRRSPHVSSSSASAIYFSEIDIRDDRIASIQSAEDISSGYSSGEGLYAGQPPKLLAREGLQRTGSLTRSRTSRVTRSTILKKTGGSDDSDENEVFDTNIIFLNDKAKNIDKLVEDKADSSASEEEFLDTLDTLHDNKKLGEDLNNFNKGPLLIACLESQHDLDVVNSSLTKISSFTPSLINENVEVKKNVEIHEEKIINTDDNLNLLNITKDVDTFSNFLQNLIESKAEKNENTNYKDDIQNKDDDVHPSFEKDVKESLAGKVSRGGKYNKKAAPPPPKPEINPPEQEDTTASPIKATLVLKPGVVKQLGLKESPCKEVFIQSPKSKRRSLVNRSPSSLSTSSNSSKSKHSFSKLMKLPKKIGFWNKDDLSVPKVKEKRSSWHCYFDQDLRPLSDSKLQSKSDNELSQNKNNIGSLHGPNMSRSGSQLSIKSLTESPLACRRLKIIRRYVDEDID